MDISNMNDLGLMVHMDEWDKREKIVDEICDKMNKIPPHGRLFNGNRFGFFHRGLLLAPRSEDTRRQQTFE